MNETFQDKVAEFVEHEIENSVTPESRAAVENTLFKWLSVVARKKPLPDLAQRLEQFRKRIAIMSQTVELRYEKKTGQILVEASGEADNVLTLLERGSDWFDPLPEARNVIKAVLLFQPEP